MGRPKQPEGKIEGFLLKNEAKKEVRFFHKPVPGGKTAVTLYRTLESRGGLSLVECRLLTGRPHQIRAHLAHIGCPILGDSKYGNNAANRELRFKYQALCAWDLRFPAQITDPRFAHLAGRVFHAEKPWYYQQILDGTLK